MFALVAIALGLGALYGWLIGHWFGRVVALIPIAIVLALIGFSAGSEIKFTPPVPQHLVAVKSQVEPGATDPFSVALRGAEQEVADQAKKDREQPIPSSAVEGLCALIGVGAAWFVSGIPLYYRRRNTA